MAILASNLLSRDKAIDKAAKNWPGDHSLLLRICILAGEGRLTIGGLAAYQRKLARGLRDAGASVNCVSRFDRDVAGLLSYGGGKTAVGRIIDDVSTSTVGPAGWARPILHRFRHLTGRQQLRNTASRLFAAAYRSSIDKVMPGDTNVVHYIGTGWELFGFAALAAARRRGAIFTVWPAVHAGTWGDSPLDIQLYDQADAVFCQSDHELEHLALLGVARHRLVRAWLAPVAEPTGNGRRFRKRHGLGERPLVLFIARKCRSKGFHVLREAMPAVLAAVPDACLIAIGPDGEPPYPPMPDSAYLDLGVASESEKADALAACDVFCMPSAAESFGIVYVEAWNAKKAVIGGPAPAVLELIDDGITGRTVQLQDAVAIAVIINDLLTNYYTRDALGQAGWEQTRSKYNWACVMQIHLDVFKRLTHIMVRYNFAKSADRHSLTS